MVYTRRVIGDLETKRKQKEIERCFYQRLYGTLSARDPKYTIMLQHAWENSTKKLFFFHVLTPALKIQMIWPKPTAAGKDELATMYHRHNKRPSGAWPEALKVQTATIRDIPSMISERGRGWLVPIRDEGVRVGVLGGSREKMRWSHKPKHGSHDSHYGVLVNWSKSHKYKINIATKCIAIASNHSHSLDCNH